LLLAMKKHQHFEYASHKWRIFIQLAFATLTLALLVYYSWSLVVAHCCLMSEKIFGLEPVNDSSGFCRSFTDRNYEEIAQS
jgi:hypothetical protein